MSKQEFESVMSQFEEFLNQPSCEFCTEFCGNSWCHTKLELAVNSPLKQSYTDRVIELVDTKKI